MTIEQITGVVEDNYGCPKLDHRQIMLISQETECQNYWHSDTAFPASGAIPVEAKKLELRKFLPKRVSAIAFACPCKPGEPIDITKGGTVETVGFAYYKNWVAIDPCEVNEEVVLTEDNTPYERVPYLEKYRRHVAEKTAALTEAVRVRYEIMATMVKLWGSYMVFGPKMDSFMVDFRRNTALHVVLKQNYSNIDTFPMNDIEMLGHLMAVNSRTGTTGGVRVARYIFGVDAWREFHMHHQVQRKGFTSACNCTEPGNDLGIRSEDCGIEFAGELNGKPVYVDSRTFVDADGMEKFYMPQDALLLEGNGMDGFRSHSVIASPSAGFKPGDFHFREWFCEPDETWTLEVQGSILMAPRNVNTNMLVRNVGRIMTFPGQGSVDQLINSEGHVEVPPQSTKGVFDTGGAEWEEAKQQAADAGFFKVCALLLGRTPPRVPCNNGTKADCVPGEHLMIVPNKDPCPTAPKKCVTKATLLSQGYDEYQIAESIFFGGLIATTAAECLNPVTQPLTGEVNEEVQEQVGG